MSGRPWTSRERAFALANKGRLTAAQICRKIGRTARAVSLMFVAAGVTNRNVNRGWEFEDFIRAKHAIGWSDAEMAAEWSRKRPGEAIKRKWLNHHRRRLGLPSNAYSQHRRERVARKTRQQIKVAGCKSLADVRAKAYREFSARNGWPKDCSPRQVQILNLLYERGPRDRPAIAKAIGLAWLGSRRSMKSNHPEGSYLANLIARGLVVQLPKLVKGRGKGYSRHLYAIAPQVTRKVPCQSH